MRDRRAYDVTKRILDAGVAGVGLVVTAPLQAAVALAVLKEHGRPVLFRQPRPGKDGRVFELVKFRTMLLPDAQRVSDADRLTPLGRFLRSTSLDELPTLWNVLKGDMSLVGPRPLLVQYLDRYTPEQARRHEVRPGITGLAQVRGRNGLDWDEKLSLDVEYVDHRSFALDLRILWETVAVVVLRRGISAEDHVTMSEFQGSAR
ncbi:sugar transferase [Propioniciclava sp. MC1595]|uniref:sugar transferase n=1 Tax=Propioniciclava sp. MC1595 TaxID=2760308 RepID=UPI00166274BD|nr:sugar transferase [Propioniciclava sp. MC1595]MBB1494632.1 sugar transferase [Propioniciclava sp. MC1595]QTE27376.1 sugar transferase [Propioniciclava sp. MC1595]